LGILRSIESRLERVVEGSVGRLFRASVAPVELARKLAKELEEGKVVSVTQTYAPNEYTIYLSPRDRTRFADFEASLRNELASYLAEHARRAGYVMPTRPRVRFETESSLHTGIFGISTALVNDDDAPAESFEAAPEAAPPAALPSEPPPIPRAAPDPVVRSPLDPDPAEGGPPGGFPPLPLDPEPAPAPPPFVPRLPDVPGLPDVVPLPSSQLPLGDLPSLAPIPDPPSPAAPAPPAPGPTVPSPAVPGSLPEVPMPAPMAFDPPSFDPPSDATMVTSPEQREELVIVHDNQRTPIEGAVVQIGRAPGCDIVLDDRNVSRRHAEIRRRGPVVVLIDLDSTNGTIVNGRRVREHPLADGDRITVGNSRLTFERRTR
jgi:hypothetical protein